MAEAGWYQDPSNPNTTRWWDGRAWTEHTGAYAAPMPVQPAYAPPHVPYPTMRPVNSKASTARVLAVVSLLINPFMILSILAIVFGAQGQAEAKRLEAGGYGRIGGGSATAAIVIGVVSCVLFVILVAVYTNTHAL